MKKIITLIIVAIFIIAFMIKFINEDATVSTEHFDDSQRHQNEMLDSLKKLCHESELREKAMLQKQDSMKIQLQRIELKIDSLQNTTQEISFKLF